MSTIGGDIANEAEGVLRIAALKAWENDKPARSCEGCLHFPVIDQLKLLARLGKVPHH